MKKDSIIGSLVPLYYHKKLILTMKLTAILLLVSVLQVSAEAFSQSSFNIHKTNITLQQLFDEVEESSDYSFFYKNNEINTTERVSVDVSDASIESLLNQAFTGKNISYAIRNTNIVLSPKTPPVPAKAPQPAKITVTGTVRDTNGERLGGVTIVAVGTNDATITDVYGEYKIRVAGVDTQLQFSFLGFKTQTVTVGQLPEINVSLEQDVQMVDDVVVVAFGKQKKDSVLSSIETVNTKDLKIASSNLTSAFAGKIPGVISYTNTGEPGADNAEFFVRGVTTFGYKVSPLILIDGFEATSTDLARIQPDDIESFSVLKDASATALYGARGANGIILVSTKSGHEGQVKINARVDMNVASPTSMNQLVDGVTYMNLYNEAINTRRAGSSVWGDFYSPQKIAGTKKGENTMLYPDINWYDALFKNYTINTKANLNVSGGGRVATYYVAGGYDRDTGILKVDNRNNFNNNININRFHLRSNVIFKIHKNTTLDTRISGRFERYNGPYTSASDIFKMAMNANPVDYPAVWRPDPANTFTPHTLFGTSPGAPTNPYAEMVRGYESRDESTITAQATLMQDLGMLLKGLKIQLKGSANVWSYYSAKRRYNPYYYALLTSDPLTGDYTLYNTNPGNPDAMLGNVEPTRNSSGHYYFEARLNWERKFGRHSIGVMTVVMAEEYVLTAGNSNNIFETLPERNVGNSGRVTYDYDSRYFVEFNYGYNGSEKFAPQYRFGFFPSFGAGWLISNEPFWKGIKETVPLFKLKGTYGWVGNDAIAGRADRFFFLSQVEVSTTKGNVAWGMDYNRNTYNSVAIHRYANPEIQWEVARKLNLGIELGLFKGQAVTIQADIFREYRDKIYMPWNNLPYSSGFGAAISGNIGEVMSQGIDASIDIKHFFSNRFWIMGRGNFTYATNEYIALNEPNYVDRYRSAIGQSTRQNWGLVAERLFVDGAEITYSPQQFGNYNYMAGDIKYKDINGDGKIDDADVIPIGYPAVPEIQYGFGLSLGYRSFDFSFFFQGNGHVSFFINPGVANGIAPFANRRNALQIVADDYWTETNPDVHAFWPRLSTTPLDNNIKNSTWWLRDGKFLRLKTVEVGYNLPEIKKLGLTSGRVYVSGENLLTFSPFRMWDPEMGGNGLAYPINRRFNIGLQLSF